MCCVHLWQCIRCCLPTANVTQYAEIHPLITKLKVRIVGDAANGTVRDSRRKHKIHTVRYVVIYGPLFAQYPKAGYICHSHEWVRALVETAQPLSIKFSTRCVIVGEGDQCPVDSPEMDFP